MFQAFSRITLPSGKDFFGPVVSQATFHRPSGALWQKSAVNKLPPDLPEMPPCDFKPEEYKSLSGERMLEIRKRNCNPITMRNTYYKKHLHVHQGYMQWLWDINGRRYLDLFSGVATVSVGHCHPKVNAAAQKQMGRLWHTTNIYMHSPIHEYAEKLASLLPDPLKVIYLTNSGSEANDLAMLMARVYTGNFDVITFRGGYHGASPYAMGLTSMAAYKYPIATGIGLPYYVFRGPWGGSRCRDSPVQTIRECNCSPDCCHAKDMYVQQLKEVLDTSVSQQIAGFFAEPIQGIGGVVQYPKGFLKEAYRLVRERGGVCIADEVQTGFGRTGSDLWGFKAHDVVPDIVTMAKGIANGFPMGAIVTTQEVANALTRGSHFNTFGGNPVACSIASSVLNTIEEDGLQQNSAHVGTCLLTELAKLRDKFDIIGDVRGKGLLIGVEMVKDKVSCEPLPGVEMNEIFEDCKDMGLLIGKGGVYGQTFRIKPPMCITKDDADFAVAVFGLAIQRQMERRL